MTEMLSRHENRSPCAPAAAVVGPTVAVAGPAAVGYKLSAETDAQLLRTLATLCCVEDCLVQLHEVTLLHYACLLTLT